MLLLLLLMIVTPLYAGELHVYDRVPGLAPSPFYKLQVKMEDSDTWVEAFTLVTQCTADTYCNTTGIYNHLANWSNSYINFEMEEGMRVQVKITKMFGEDRHYPITKAVVHPRNSGSCRITSGGEVVVTVTKPALFTDG